MIVNIADQLVDIAEIRYFAIERAAPVVTVVEKADNGYPALRIAQDLIEEPGRRLAVANKGSGSRWPGKARDGLYEFHRLPAPDADRAAGQQKP